jgi:biotin transport system substrate-specific component
MTSLTTTLRQTKPSTIGWTIGFTLALAAAAQVTIPIPGTPVPFTLQPLVVVLAGLMLGPVAGATSMILYLLAGAVGLPVFSPVGAPGVLRFIGPTGGYLIAYPVAAWAAGSLGAKKEKFTERFFAACVGIAMIFVGGIAHLTVLSGSIAQAVKLGITPFFLLDFAKAAIAAGVTGSRKPASQPSP